MKSNMTPPKVFGVEMRSDGSNGFELEGVRLFPNGFAGLWFWSIVIEHHLYSGADASIARAVDELEQKLTRIRAAVDRLGK